MARPRLKADAPLTNAEKQKRHRRKLKAQGFRPEQVWKEHGIFLKRQGEKQSQGWERLSRKDFKKHLDELLADYDELNSEVVYAEIFQYAEIFKRRFDKLLVQLDKAGFK